jgi:lysyl oxidase-like protein 2/3/4
MHPHYTNYARYELLDGTNQVVAVGGKFGFCVEDSLCPDGTGRVYNCDHQGLTVGCADEYPYSLGCQYIDITAVASGIYTLQMTADPSGEIDEGDETNNVALLPVAIAKPREPDEEIPGAWVRLDSPQPTPLPGRTKLLKFIAQGAAPIDLPDAPHAPTLVGASVRARDTVRGTDLLIQLPRAGWRGLGQPPGSLGYRYHGSLRPGDCRSALITSSRVRAVCQIAGAPMTPIGGDLAITLTMGDGSKRYCATFGGLTVRNDTLRFESRRAPALPCGG